MSLAAAASLTLARGRLGLLTLLMGGALAACRDSNEPAPEVGSVSGTVRDAATDAPLAGATIVVAGIEAQTGSDGGYQLDGVPAGTHEGTATMAGYVARAFEVEVRVGVMTVVGLELVREDSDALRIMTTALLPATVDVPYEFELQAAGGTPPYEWDGSMPQGLDVTGDGLVGGTPGYPAGEYTVGVLVRDAASSQVTASFRLMIEAASGLHALGGQLSGGRVGVPYADAVGAEGGAPPYTFELDGLPGGIELDPATGQLSGTPLGGTGPEGEPIKLRLLVRDAVGASAFDSVSIGVVPGPLVITSDLPDGQVGVHYESWFEYEGGFGNYDDYTVVSGILPPGLHITGPESLYGQRLLGTPTLPGTYRFTVQLALCDGRPPECTQQLATRDYEVLIAPSPVSIVTSSLPDGEVGTPYSVFLVREGGAGPFTWDVVSGSLPLGISLSAAGELTGTPTLSGAFSFEVRVRDTSGQSATAVLALHLGP